MLFGNFFYNLSLRAKTLMLIIALTGIPAVVFVFVLLGSFAQSSKDVEGRALTETTTLIRQELLNSVEAKAKIYDLTFKDATLNINAIKDQSVSTEDRERAFHDFPYRNRVASAVYALSPESVVSSTSTLPKGLAFTDNGKRLYSGAWFGPYQKTPDGAVVMTYGLPIWNDAGLQEVLAFDVTADTMLNEIIAIDPSQSSYVVIVRSDGKVITQSAQFQTDFQIDPSEKTNILRSRLADALGLAHIVADRNGLRGSFNLNGESGLPSKIAVYANIPSFDGKIFVISPLDELLQVQKEKTSEIGAVMQHTAFTGLFYVLIIGIFVGVLSFYLLHKQVIRPIALLKAGIDNLKRTDFNAQIPITSGGEIGALSKDFNDMAGRLRESYSTLEGKVKEKTTQLATQVDELGRMNRFMVDREIKMAELKKEITTLKEAIEKKA